MDTRSLESMSVAQLRRVLETMGASPRGARTKRALIDRIRSELRIRHDLAAIRDGARP
jgi:hypothetical protein